MKVLYVASEAVPFAKTGGLADVAGSLPKALKAEGVDVRVIMPKFGKIPEKFRNAMEHVYDGEIPVSWRSKYVGLDKIEHDGVTYYFVDNEEYFRREGFYGYGDDAERFSFFCRAVLNLLPAMDFWPDVIHTNDWHSGLVNVLLKLEHQGDERYEKIRTLYTIHNLKYQGVFPKDVMSDVLGLDWKYFNNGDLEFYDAVNFMKGGLIYADYISTVSKTYAKEIQYEYFGEHLDGLLRSRQDTLFGIVNGIDYDIWNPWTDPMLHTNYDITNVLPRKKENKRALQEELGLWQDDHKFVIGLVSRLTNQKGLDLVNAIMPQIVDEHTQVVVLGTGDRLYEDAFRYYENAYRGNVCSSIMYDEGRAHRIYAGADAVLVPSQFEPCGLTQLIGMHYGTIPIVRETGGLKDTVQPHNEFTHDGNGFTFDRYDAGLLLDAINRAKTFYFTNRYCCDEMVQRDMDKNVSWENSAWQYRNLYLELTRDKT